MSSFLLPNETIGQQGVDFFVGDVGERQIAGAFGKTAGTFDAWREAVNPVSHHPRCELGLYASLAPVLLYPTKMPNFIVEWCGQTSSGKTTTLMVAASAWGNPDPTGSHGIIGSWGATKVGIERRLKILNDLPTILDDTKTARQFGKGETIIPSLIYMATNGHGEARGTPGGIQKLWNWRTVLLSTGEQRCIDFDKSGGTAARVVTMWGSPFEPGAKADIRHITEGIRENYGFAGSAFVRFVESRRQEWPAWRSKVKEIADLLIPAMVERCSDFGVVSRVAVYLGLLDLTGRLAHEALELPWKYDSPIFAIAPNVGGEASTARRHAEALSLLAAHLASNPSKMINSPGGESEGVREPSDGWIGGYPDSVSLSRPWEFLYISPDWLRSFLTSRGFEIVATCRHWRDAGWLKCGSTNHLTNNVRLGGETRRMYCFTRDAMAEAGFGEAKVQLPLYTREPGDDDDEVPF